MPERPGPPLRSYTDLVQAEVEQATASLLHPPAPPPTAAQRTTSADLLERDDGEDEDEADGFSSEEEPFRYRPPSIASVATSQRSSRQGVRIEDWSDRQSSAFAKDVRIKGYHAVGSEGSGFVVFDIEIDTLPANPSAQGTTIRIHKRYSSFVRLRSDLLRSFPRLRSVVPRLPPKSSFGARVIPVPLQPVF
ncbi:hypothetical protein JCM10213_003585 [Rhodosporidiobolus nylandii]